MKTFIIVILSFAALVFVLFYIWTWVYSLSLRCLSTRKLEAYFIKLYRRYRDNPRDFNDNYIHNLYEMAYQSWELWSKGKEAAVTALINETNVEQVEIIKADIAYCNQKVDFWNEAQNNLKKEIKRREYFNSFHN